MTAITAHGLAELVLILRAASRTEIMPRWRRLQDGDVRAKSGPLDLVTDADEAAERMITGALHHLFPGCAVVGEEAAAADPSLLARLEEPDLLFLVDPIDGTANFAAGLPLFGCMVAALVRGEIVAAAIHDPLGDDTAVALRGEGAWTEQADGVRTALRVAAPVPVGEMSGVLGWRHLPAAERVALRRNMECVAASFDLRCAAHSYRLAAAGHCHYLVFNRMMPWDHAPGWLLHREAGGSSARLDGAAYRPAETTGGLICAPDRASWEALNAALFAA